MLNAFNRYKKVEFTLEQTRPRVEINVRRYLGGGWLTPRLGCFTSGKRTRYPLYRRLDGPQGRSVRVRKILTPPGFDPSTVPRVFCAASTLHRRRVDAGQNTRGTPTVNHDSGVGANEKTTEQQLHNIPNRRPTKQEVWFKDTPEDGAKHAPKHVG